MKKFFILVLFIATITCAKAEKLKNTVWSIDKVECTVLAEDTTMQFFLDSLFNAFKQKMIVPADQYTYEFTPDELLRKIKGKESRWKYKEADDNLIVDMGKGIILIQKYEIKKDTLILEMDKPLFFLSEFGSKVENVKSMVKDISLKYYYKKN